MTSRREHNSTLGGKSISGMPGSVKMKLAALYVRKK